MATQPSSIGQYKRNGCSSSSQPAMIKKGTVKINNVGKKGKGSKH